MLKPLASTPACRLPVAPEGLPPIGFWSSLRDAYEFWREDRDVQAIERALGQLSERQLNLIGMSHTSLRSDVATLIDRAEEGRAIVDDVLRLVDHSPSRVPLRPPAA